MCSQFVLLPPCGQGQPQQKTMLLSTCNDLITIMATNLTYHPLLGFYEELEFRAYLHIQWLLSNITNGLDYVCVHIIQILMSVHFFPLFWSPNCWEHLPL